jgi:type II secretory pathway pseudopilin PulG
MLKRSKQQGDTLIEVLFAVSVFSLVAIGSLAVMNQGSAASQRSLEITLVREQMDAQAETLRFLNSSYIAAFRSGSTYAAGTPAGQWALMSDNVKTHPIANNTQLGATACPVSYQRGSFIMNPQLATFIDFTQGVLQPSKTFSQINYVINQPTIASAEGIWIEATSYDPTTSADTAQSNLGYIDFRIFACWDSLGQDIPVTLGTIVRLYEPR